MVPTIESMLIVFSLAFGIDWLKDGRLWLGGGSVFISGTLFGAGLVLYKPWTLFRLFRRHP